MPGTTDFEIVDFPVLFPLCEVRVVYGTWVSFCSNERVRRSRMCRYHLNMRKARAGRWQGREVVVS